MEDDLKENARRHRNCTAMAKKRTQEYDPNVIYLKTKELAKMCKCNDRAIKQAIYDKTLSAKKYLCGSCPQWLIHPDEAQRYIKEKGAKN